MQRPRPFSQSPWHSQHKGHGHVGGVFGQNVRGVGDGNATLTGAGQINMINAGAVVGDQAQIIPGVRQNFCINPIRNGGNQDVGLLDRLNQISLGHRRVIQIKMNVEQLHHACFNAIWKFAGNDNDRFFWWHGISSLDLIL